MSEYELRPIRPDEEEAFLRAVSEGFQGEMRDEEVAHYRGTVDDGADAGGVRTSDAIVATSELMSLRLAVPGAVVPMAGVTAVAVHAVHRRRGLLDRMMRGHLRRSASAGEEALAGLWASEAGIYGRWGFGAATRAAHLTIRSPEARLTVAAVRAARPRAGAPEALLADLRAVHAAVGAGRAGRRSGATTGCGSFALADFEADRDGAGRLRARRPGRRGRSRGLRALRRAPAAAPRAGPTTSSRCASSWPRRPRRRPGCGTT